MTALLSTETFWMPVWLSVKVTFCAGLLVIIAGTFVGRLMAHAKFKGRAIVETILMLPIVLPPTVIGFLLITLLGRNSMLGIGLEWVLQKQVIFTWLAAVVAATVVAFPLMYHAAKIGFQGDVQAAEEAARIDGAGRWQVFWYVSIPLAKRALLSGAILAFARALGEFGATFMFAGNIPGKTQTIPTAIYIALEAGEVQLAWLWVVLLIGLSFLMLWMVRKND
ncbi:molybdate transport system permease protein [Terribacillus halophilus]|uniref:Molybdenum transport system permease n=1 Tax=Terribacillus halophilus TaxID=361279 RepID=A0A1G6TII5_9BACI|nr:molybdate ABC transporter permease subunit [Terribacillus halophilus]SDD28135.1 molybdate transport system permease protein [Terribacillus halophilus]